ncbi:MAG: energy-coupled thiamine transporter ThiT [Oscillospiraceae bacterium]|nr:energy-coupled thiamine transporter ThiT [Oscillospiraceae bacterium]
MEKKKSSKNVRALCEGAIMIALAQVLGYIKFYELPYGGSVTFAMVPIVFYAVRWGVKKGLLASFAFGILQLALDGAYAYTWQAMILDYLVAFTPVGLAGLFRGKSWGVFAGSVVGLFVRFIAHTLSGVFVWAEYMPESFLGMPMASPWIYSPLYNGVHMGLTLVLTLVAFAILYKPMKKYYLGNDIRV